MKLYITTFLFAFSLTVTFGQVYISWPLERAVFQRGNSGQTNVSFGGQATVSTSSYQIQYRIITMDKFGNEINVSTQPWINISSFGGGRTFNFNLNISTGWYKMYIRASQNGNQIGGSSSVRFGVGEVLIIAGQSNAQSSGSPTPPALSNTAYDCVISNNEQLFCKRSIAPFPIFGKMESYSRIGPNGGHVWAYQKLGNMIVDREGTNKVIPVLFFNVGASGTSVENWSITANDQNASVSNPLWGGSQHCNSEAIPTSENEGQGQPYVALKNTLNYYASMFGTRGVLWHQGESDTHLQTSSLNYSTFLNNVIQKSRDHYDTNLPWAISNVSRIYIDNTEKTSSIIIQGQDNSRSSKSAALAASNSDGIYDPIVGNSVKRQGDRTHFNTSGLSDLANQYFANFGLLMAKTSVQAISRPTITVTPNSSGGATLTVPLGFSEYRWVQYDGNYKDVNCGSSPNPCSNTITVASNSGNWRCYVRNTAKSNFALTAKVYLPVTMSNARVASETLFDGEVNSISSSVYPNPAFSGFETTIEFDLNADANAVRLDIVDENGNIITTLANGSHAFGKYQYPFSTSRLPKEINTFYYRLTVDDLVQTKRLIIVK